MSPFTSTLTSFLSFLTLLTHVALVLYVIASVAWRSSRFLIIKTFLQNRGLTLAFFVALFGTLGSFAYSYIAGFEACSLCIIQRYILVALVILLFFQSKTSHARHSRESGNPVSSNFSHNKIYWIPVPRRISRTGFTGMTILLNFVGILISLYHSYLQSSWVSSEAYSVVCALFNSSISCSKRYFLEFGYITIPVMSLTVFIVILFLLIRTKNEEPSPTGKG